MSGIATEVVVILLLLVANGVFAMSELAIVTARKVRLEQRAEAGDAGARAALALAHDPTQFLSTVQVGITLIGVLAGAFGGATIAEELAAGFKNAPSLAPYADGLALGIVVTTITYLSLLIGELILDLRAVLRQPLFVPASMSALDLLEEFRRSRQHIAVALDEYGGLQGVVLLDNLVEAVLGALPGADESAIAPIERRNDHTWVMGGSVTIEDLESTLDLNEIPDDDRHGVRTLGGFIMTLLGRVPKEAKLWNGTDCASRSPLWTAVALNKSS